MLRAALAVLVACVVCAASADYAPCAGTMCNNPEVFKVCSDGVSSISPALCLKASAKCCIDQDFHGFGRCNRECSADAINLWKSTHNLASAASTYVDYAPCTGAMCNDPDVFKVCSDGISSISTSLCKQAIAKCCIDQDFHGFGRCNRECSQDAIDHWLAVNFQGASNTNSVDYAPCTGSLCNDPEVFKVCSDGVSSISTSLCRQATAKCCIDQDFHGFGRCNRECSADTIAQWKDNLHQGSGSTYTDYEPCTGAMCNDPDVFKVCSDGISSISTSLCKQANAKCCIDQDFHGFGRCNRECSSDAIDQWKAARTTAAGSSAYVDYAPCSGDLCNDPEVFKVCSNGVNAISSSLCRQASAQCCIDQDFHGFGRCNRQCDADAIAAWKEAHSLSSGSAYTDYAPCSGAMCADADVFKVCSDGVSSISPALCRQANAKCCLDQDFHGFGRCNRECTVDSVAEWKSMHSEASGSSYTDYAPCTASQCADADVFKVCSNGVNAISNAICRQADAKCCIDQDFHGLSRCNRQCDNDAIAQWKALHSQAAASSYPDYAPCSGAMCNDPEVFKVCSNGVNAISPAICKQAAAQCCIDQDFHGFGRCNRQCDADAIAAWKEAHVQASSSTYTDYAPCSGSMCNDPEVFKVCSDGLSSISSALCRQANAKCCIDQDFHGFGRCNRQCDADAVAAWKEAHAAQASGSTYVDYEPCAGSVCNDPEVFIVCSNGVNAISNAICRQATAKCCIDQDFHGFGRCNRECSSDAIAAWKEARAATAGSSTYVDYAPCSGSMCNDPEVFKVCSDGVSAISTSLCRQANAQCCLDQNFHGFGRCNLECTADTIALWKSTHNLASAASTYVDYAPCSGSMCNDPNVFKVCSDGISSISTSLCRQANAKCCIDQDFHGFGRCNRECSADAISNWKAAHSLAASSTSTYVDYEPCSGAVCNDPEVFKVCSDGLSSISSATCQQSYAKCCIDQNFHGFSRCNRECSADAINAWKAARTQSSTTRAPVVTTSAPGFTPCMGSVCSDDTVFKTCTDGSKAVSCRQQVAMCCMYNDFRTMSSCNRECSANTIANFKTDIAAYGTPTTTTVAPTASSSSSSPSSPASSSSRVDYAPCTGDMCSDADVFKVCSNGVNAISRALCQQSTAVCCIDQNFHGFGRCNRECSADAISAWKSRMSTQIVAPVPMRTFTPCSGSVCSDVSVFKTCTDGVRPVSCSTSNAKCCLYNDFATLGSCNRECSADAITDYKKSHPSSGSTPVASTTVAPVTIPAKTSSTYVDYAPCTGAVCNNPEVFKVCSNGISSISNAICQDAASAKCCIDQDFHGFGRCNRECSADAIAQWQTLHNVQQAQGSSSSYVDYEPCSGSQCQASDVFIVCSNGVNAISNAICKQSVAKCCIDQNFHGFGRCNRECSADAIAQWREARHIAVGATTASPSDQFLSYGISGSSSSSVTPTENNNNNNNGGNNGSSSVSKSDSINASALLGGIVGGLLFVSLIVLGALRAKNQGRAMLADQDEHPYHKLETGDVDL